MSGTVEKHCPPFDVLVIGSGAAGLGLALSLADRYSVAVVCKDDLLSSSSQYAQGGIAAVMASGDSHASHIADTLNAGAGLCDPAVVDYTVRHAKQAIEWLVRQGVEFTMADQHYHLTQEGGHSQKRILHSADKTGAAVVKTLSQQVLDHPNIYSLTQYTALELILREQHCYGAYFLENQTQKITAISANITVLATGGASMVYQHTTNPNHTSGDGIVLAAKAGANIANMEFQQFHPTCFYNPHGNTFLITEVIRGEGAKLVHQDGTAFMSHYDARQELAPRDIVSRAIEAEINAKNVSHVCLDIRHREPQVIKMLFPTIEALCCAQGINITRDLIPVVPAAHYSCGGVVTDLHGKTNVAGLFAVGEVACTGLHGANRIASNSLLECLVFAKSAAQQIDDQLRQHRLTPPLPGEATAAKQHHLPPCDQLAVDQLTDELRQCVWQHIGITRSNAGLAQAATNITALRQQFTHITNAKRLNKSIIELGNLFDIAQMMVLSAQHRQESRGAHYHRDFPNTAKTAKNTVLSMVDNTIHLH